MLVPVQQNQTAWLQGIDILSYAVGVSPWHLLQNILPLESWGYNRKGHMSTDRTIRPALDPKQFKTANQAIWTPGSTPKVWSFRKSGLYLSTRQIVSSTGKPRRWRLMGRRSHGLGRQICHEKVQMARAPSPGGTLWLQKEGGCGHAPSTSTQLNDLLMCN